MYHPITAGQMAQHHIDTFHREAAAHGLAALVKATASRPVGLRERLTRTVGRVRLISRGAAA